MTDQGEMKRCRNCHRAIQRVDGVGWLHPDPRIYFVAQVEPRCEEAVPDDSVLMLAIHSEGVTRFVTADRGCQLLGGTFGLHGYAEGARVCWCGSQLRDAPETDAT